MTNLMISKATEAKALATVWNMAAESLDPESYEALEKAFRILCETRNIPKEILACEQRILSGKLQHNSDCETSNAPAYVCAPCDCDFEAKTCVEAYLQQEMKTMQNRIDKLAEALEMGLQIVDQCSRGFLGKFQQAAMSALKHDGSSCSKEFPTPVIVSNDSDADEMNRLHGERYGYDWKYEGEQP